MLELHGHRAVVAAAVASSLAALGAVAVFQSLARRQRRTELSDTVRAALERSSTHPVPDPAKPSPAVTRKHIEYDDELVREQLARNYTFLGEPGMAAVRAARVVVVGCGGVGSWAAVMLVRSGVSHIRLVDFDYVTLSSLNRHATALLADVGTPKVACVARTLREIARWATVDPRVELWRDDDAGHALLADADWVVDAIDNISTKVDLLRYCHANGIKVFSSMGAGAKCDPTRIQIADISQTHYDPLARSVRRRLRLGAPPVVAGVPVVYSTEVPGHVRLLPLPDDEFARGAVHELAPLDDFRVRVLPVLGPLPAIFGLHISAFIVCALAGRPVPNPLPVRHRHKLYASLARDLGVREARGAPLVGRPPLDEDDAAFLLEDLFRARSVVHGGIAARPALVRWDPARPVKLDNVVLMERDEADRHEREGAGAWSDEVRERVARRAQEAREAERWRGHA